MKLNNLIKENKKGEIFSWLKCKHIQRGYTHCSECLALDNCWFYSLKSPQLPHHPNCHCLYNTILPPTMKDCWAYMPIGKFLGYIFDEKGLLNGKRKIFTNCGFTIKDCVYLKDEYERQALKAYVEGNYKLGTLNENGQQITIDICIENNGKTFYRGSGWMVRRNGLITNNTPITGAIHKELERKYENENR